MQIDSDSENALTIVYDGVRYLFMSEDGEVSSTELEKAFHAITDYEWIKD